ncbi:MAG: holo-ACP synthase [Lachnospiraceae bacterium]|nr:holo-ACP synthase [Lachnospiraceae bacterium]
MLFGIGTDIIDVERLTKPFKKKGVQRLFTDKELDYIWVNGSGSSAFMKAAGNYAAKEAVVKAFGTGFVGMNPCDIEVLRHESGAPYVRLYRGAKKFAKENNITRIMVSISNLKDYAIAISVIENDPVEDEDTEA